MFREADRVRKKYMGDGVHLRGIIEFSNHCAKDCLYCGLRAGNRSLGRYRMSDKEILAAARQAKELQIRTVVLQSGEDRGFSVERLCRLVKAVKRLGVAVTLSVGELSREDYRRLKKSGADRYLLKFETSDKRLYEKLRPGCRFEERLRCLKDLRELGYQVGSGSMVGLPGQTAKSLAEDIALFKQLDLDMIGIGPFIPHPRTPLAKAPQGKLERTLRVLAATRIMVKDCHMPATTSAATVDPKGREKALCCGANVVMPNMTPAKYRRFYEIYPNKVCINEEAVECLPCIKGRILSVGRKVAKGRGDSLKR